MCVGAGAFEEILKFKYAIMFCFYLCCYLITGIVLQNKNTYIRKIYVVSMVFKGDEFISMLTCFKTMAFIFSGTQIFL